MKAYSRIQSFYVTPRKKKIYKKGRCREDVQAMDLACITDHLCMDLSLM